MRDLLGAATLALVLLSSLSACYSGPPYDASTTHSLKTWPTDPPREPHRHRGDAHPRTRVTHAAHPKPSARPEPHFDNALHLDHGVIVQLAAMADLYGYGLGPGTTLSYGQAKNFAYGVSVVCDSLRSGESTVEDAVADDVSMGAPRSDAEGFNRYLDQTFCPAYYRAGN